MHVVVVIIVVYLHSSSQKDENNTCYHFSARLGEEEGLWVVGEGGQNCNCVCCMVAASG